METQPKKGVNIKMDIQYVGSRFMDWVDLAPYGTGGGHL